MSRTVVFFTLVFAAHIFNTVRAKCMCCDEIDKLIEFTVLSCKAEPVNYKALGYRYLGKHDFVIDALIKASVPIINKKTLEFESQQNNLSIKQRFVYEKRNDTSCDDFFIGQSKVMLLEDKECVMIKDNKLIHNVLCVHSDKRISELPILIQKIIEKSQ